MSVEALMQRYYSGDRYNGTLQFYSWIRQFLSPSARVLNVGAGPAAREPARCFKGEVQEVVGVDIDPCVLDNPQLDKAFVIENGRFGAGEAQFDLVVSDYVLEHVEQPQPFFHEVFRALKPGGDFFFRTPNRRHYVTAIAIATPHWLHEKIANKARGAAGDAHEPYPTFFRLNTPAAIRAAAKAAGFSALELRMVECEPSYLKFSTTAFLAGAAYERLVNSSDMFAGFRANIFGRLTKAP